MNIDRTGTFIVSELERVLSTTKKKALPQLVMRVLIHEWFDETANDGQGVWVDFTESRMEGTAYCLLAYIDKEGNPTASFQHDQFMEVYGWSGRDYKDLTLMDAPERFQIRVKDNDPKYVDKKPFVINGIGKADDDPRSGLKQIDDKAIAELNAKFASVLAGSVTSAPATAARKAPPKAPPKTLPTVPAESEPEPKKQTAAEKKAAKKTKSEKIARANAELQAAKEASAESELVVAPPEAPLAADQLDDENTVKRDSITKEEAFASVYELSPGVGDDTRNAAWTVAIADVAGPKTSHKDITGEQWHKIMHDTLDDVGAV